jgi:large subunit ribosomal protein L13
MPSPTAWKWNQLYKKNHATTRKTWFHIDAENHVLGRLASKISYLLQGKHKPTYTRNIDNGDYVVVTNIKKIILTGKKWDQKVYRYHTRWPGGLKEIPIKRLFDRNPERILREAVMGMLPKYKIRKSVIDKLKIFPYDYHPYQPELSLSLPFMPPHITWEDSNYRPVEVDPKVHKGWFVSIEDQPDKILFKAEKSSATRKFRQKRTPSLNPDQKRQRKLRFRYLVSPWDAPGKSDQLPLSELINNTDITDPEVQKKMNLKWPPPDPDSITLKNAPPLKKTKRIDYSIITNAIAEQKRAKSNNPSKDDAKKGSPSKDDAKNETGKNPKKK